MNKKARKTIRKLQAANILGPHGENAYKKVWAYWTHKQRGAVTNMAKHLKIDEQKT